MGVSACLCGCGAVVVTQSHFAKEITKEGIPGFRLGPPGGQEGWSKQFDSPGPGLIIIFSTYIVCTSTIAYALL